MIKISKFSIWFFCPTPISGTKSGALATGCTEQAEYLICQCLWLLDPHSNPAPPTPPPNFFLCIVLDALFLCLALPLCGCLKSFGKEQDYAAVSRWVENSSWLPGLCPGWGRTPPGCVCVSKFAFQLLKPAVLAALSLWPFSGSSGPGY